METMTKGHQMPQKANWAKRVRLFQNARLRRAKASGRVQSPKRINRHHHPLRCEDDRAVFSHAIAEFLAKARGDQDIFSGICALLWGSGMFYSALITPLAVSI